MNLEVENVAEQIVRVCRPGFLGENFSNTGFRAGKGTGLSRLPGKKQKVILRAWGRSLHSPLEVVGSGRGIWDVSRLVLGLDGGASPCDAPVSTNEKAGETIDDPDAVDPSSFQEST